MTDYCVIGVGNEERGVKVQEYSPDLRGTIAFQNLQKSILDIHLLEAEESPALCVMPLSSNKIAISEITYIKKSEVETRPHCLQHAFVKEKEEFVNELKDGLDDKKLDSLFFHGPMKLLGVFRDNNKLEYKKPELSTEMSGFWRGLTKQQQWNFFANLVMGKQLHKKLALGVDENVNRRNVIADAFRILPHQYAMNMSVLSSGECAQTEFDLRLVSAIKESDTRHYKFVLLRSFCDIKGKELLYLKSIVTGSDRLRGEFYQSKYMKTYSSTTERLPSFEEMEEAAILFLVEKGIIDKPAMFRESDEKKKEEGALSDCADLYQEFKTYYMADRNIEHSYNIALLRKRLFSEYKIADIYEVRLNLRKKLSEWLEAYGYGEAFAQLALLTFEMTDTEYSEYRKKNPYIICGGPYYYKDFLEFLKNSPGSKMNRYRLVKKYRNMLGKKFF